MSLSLACPHCQYACTVSDAARGKRVRCPRCGQVFVASSPAAHADAGLTEGIQPHPVSFPAVEWSPPPRRIRPVLDTPWSQRSVLPWVLGGMGVLAFLVCGGVVLIGALLLVPWARLASSPPTAPVAFPPEQGPVGAGPMQPQAPRHAVGVSPEWTLDVRRMQFPNRPLSGKMLGADFQPDRVELINTGLSLHSGNDWVLIFLTLKPGQDLYEFGPNDPPGQAPAIHLHIHSTNPPQATVFQTGYALRVEFGQLKDGKRTGKLYLCLPDERKSAIAGSFTAEVR